MCSPIAICCIVGREYAGSASLNCWGGGVALVSSNVECMPLFCFKSKFSDTDMKTGKENSLSTQGFVFLRTVTETVS